MRLIIPLVCIILFVAICIDVTAGKGTRGGRRRKSKNKGSRKNDRSNITTTTTSTAQTTTAEATLPPNRPIKENRFHDNMNRNGPMPDPPRKGQRRRPNSNPGSAADGTAQRGIANTKQQGVAQTRQVKSNALSQQQKEVFLNAHNDFRSQVQGPYAANMIKMEWDDTLAEMAQGWSDQCVFAHGNPPNISPYSWVGQNIWAGSGTGWDHYGMVEDWYNEVSDYDYQSNTCSGVCGHYTQIVWAETTHVGCAITTCTSIQNLGWSPATILVCNYGEGGNYVGQKPYVSGAPCSQCPASHPVCVDGKLCASAGSNPDSGSGGYGNDNSGNNGGNNSNSGNNGGNNDGIGDGGNNGGSKPTACGATLTDEQGAFSSPGWPSPYPLNMHCQWLIRSKAEDKITLTVTYMDVEVASGCSWDYLKIQTSPTDPGIKYCGMQPPPPVTSESGIMLVTFHSDYAVPRGGFNANYKIIEQNQDECGGLVKESKGAITSPGWPTPFGPHEDCIWTIRVPQNKRVSIWFTAFNLTDHVTCSSDHVTLKLGDEKVPMRLCGSEVTSGKYTSIGREVELRFKSTHQTGKRGFRAQFKAVR